MQETNNSVGNITPDAIENRDLKSPVAKTSKFDAKNYLNVKLAQGENEKKLIIRVITVSKDTNKAFAHIKMHNTPVPLDIAPSGFKSYICLHDTQGKYTDEMGTKCPFCEKRTEYYNEYKKRFDESEKLREQGRADEAKKLAEEAKAWARKSGSMRSNDVTILRCIERGKENEGVKFWKFNAKVDKSDPEGQMIQLYWDKKEECEMDNRPVENIFDNQTGYDFKVTITRIKDREGRWTDKTSIKVSLFGSPKPLSTDAELMDKWINDEKVWSDVFAAKPYDYTSLIIEGKTPWYDGTQNKWVEKKSKAKLGDNDEEHAAQADKEMNSMKPTNTAPTTTNGDDELPF